METQKLSVGTMSNGAAVERIDYEIQRVLDNILDPNTTPTVMREVTLKLKFKPGQDRDFSSVEIHTSSKLAPITEKAAVVILGQDIDGKAEASEKVEQTMFPEMDEKHDNITEMRRAK